VANCVNDNVVEPQDSWKHNGFGVANNPEVLRELGAKDAIDLSGSKLFFYSAYEHELESDGWTFEPHEWRPITRAASSDIPNDVTIPRAGDGGAWRLLGYDVVVFGDFLEHSPLSCNSVAAALKVNSFCLFDDLEEAKAAIDSGKFGGGCEEGIYKIFSVSILERAEG